MHILRLSYDYPPPWDGLAPGIYELTEAQRKLGNEVAVFSSKKFPRAVRRFSLFLTTAPAVLVGYLFYRLRGRRFDVVHGHGHITACFNLYKLFFGFLDKTPYVLHLHITAAGRETRAKEKGSKLDFWTKHFEWPLHKFSDRIGCKVADAVMATSPVVREEAIKFYGVSPEKVFVVENGVNTQLFEPRKPQIVNRKSQILYVGALTPRKNVHLLIEASKFLPPEYHLVIVGRGEEEYQKQLEGLVKKYTFYDRIKFAGYVEYPQLPSYYQNANLFVLPSSYEGLPKVVLEALACGVPVLASGFAVKGEIGGLRFLKNLDAKNLALEIKKMVEAKEKVDVALIRQKYDWLVKAKEIQVIYQKIVS